jgi:hypothetical protein
VKKGFKTKIIIIKNNGERSGGRGWNILATE